jgi:Phytanoyl-CoA dioxygenase (PhyH)
MQVVSAVEYVNDGLLQADFRSNGYVIVSGGLDLTVLQNARDSVARGIEILRNPRPPRVDVEDFIDQSIIDLNATRSGQDELYALHESLRKLSVWCGLVADSAGLAARCVGNENPFSVVSWGFLLGLPDDTRLAYDFHQETSYMVGAKDVMNVHFPFLRPSTIENGTMSVLEGSHKEGVLETNRSKVSDNSYTNMVPKRINELKSKYREVAFHLELGDIALFHKDLVHKSNPNLSAALRPPAVFRLTQDLRYSFTKS